MLGLVGMVLFLVAVTLPWYVVSGRFPDANYPDWTVLIQFDGIRGLYVAPELQDRTGFAVPSVAFPIFLLFALLSVRKFARLLRADSHKKRASLLLRGVIHIAIPIVITVVAISQISSVVPASAPEQATDLAREVSTHPFGGERNFTVTDPAGQPHDGSLRWGFGPALQVMVGAAGLMLVGSFLEKGAQRRSERASA